MADRVREALSSAVEAALRSPVACVRLAASTGPRGSSLHTWPCRRKPRLSTERVTVQVGANDDPRFSDANTRHDATRDLSAHL